MADSKISDLTSGTTPLAGTEEVVIVQGGATVKITTQDVADLVSSENLGNADLTQSANGTRLFTLAGNASSDKLTIENNSGTDIVQFKGNGDVLVATQLVNNGDFKFGGAGTHKMILGGALSTDNFTIRDSGDSLNYFQVRGDGAVSADHLSLGASPSYQTSLPLDISNGATTSHKFVTFSNNSYGGEIDRFSNLHLGSQNNGGYATANTVRGALISDSAVTTTIGNRTYGTEPSILAPYSFGLNHSGWIVAGAAAPSYVGMYKHYIGMNWTIGEISQQDGTNVLSLISGTAPTTQPTDGFQIYSADESAGNACLHTMTEAGDVIKLYKEAALTASDGTLANAVTRIGEIETALQNLGLLT